MKKKRRILFVVVGVLFIIMGLVAVRLWEYQGVEVNPKTHFILSTTSASVVTGEEFTVVMKVNPNGNTVLVVEPHILYDQSVIELIDTNSVAPFVNVLSNVAVTGGSATISLGTVSAREPVVNEVEAVEFTFRALRPGNTLISFSEDSFVGSLDSVVKTSNMLEKHTGLNIVVTDRK